jgi:hypothetical protein
MGRYERKYGRTGQHQTSGGKEQPTGVSVRT